MKIMLISTAALPCPPPQYGGIEQVVWDLASELSKRGHEVTLVATQKSQPIPKVKLIETVDPDTQTWQEMSALQFYANQVDEHDIIHDHSHQKLLSFFLYQQNPMAKSFKIVNTTHTHNFPPIQYEKPNATALSQWHANYIQSKTGFDVKYVYNGIDIEKYKYMPNKSDRFLFIGRPNPEKGALKAIEFCKKLNVPLDVVAGRLKTEPIKYAVMVARACKLGSPWVYHGSVSHQAKIHMLKYAKAMIFPLQWDEPFGLTAIEAMACGTPVIAFNRGPMSEIIKHGETGFIANTEDEFLGYMKRVDEIKPHKCREWVKQKFTIEIMANEYEKLYNQVINGDYW